MNKHNGITLALDAMGGDNAPQAVVGGMVKAMRRHSGLSVRLYGDKTQLATMIPQTLANRVEIIHCTHYIKNDDKASSAVRQGRESSMGLAIKAVKEGEADAAISSGNTGALMALALFTLRTMKGVDRPAICTAFPTKKNFACMLDLGANVDCTPSHLTQFALMGEVFAITLLNIAQPRIGLLNIGVEPMKGNDTIRQAATMIENTPLKGKFMGFVEGDDIGKGDVDVIVTDGFTGNVALKVMEGTAKLMAHRMRMAYRRSWYSWLGYVFSIPALSFLRKSLDPRNYNGAVLLGLNGIVIKSHGSTDELGFANAIHVAVEMIQHGFYERIAEEMQHMPDGIIDDEKLDND